MKFIKQWFKCLFGKHEYVYEMNKGWQCLHCPSKKKGTVDFSSISLTGFDALNKDKY